MSLKRPAVGGESCLQDSMPAQLTEMKFALQTLSARRAFTAAYIDGLFKTIYYIAIDNRKKGIVKVEILIALVM